MDHNRFAEVIAPLAALRDADAVAAHLAQQGTRYAGLVGDADLCPIAQYVGDKLGRPVRVDGYSVEVPPLDDEDAVEVHFELPPTLTQFIGRFDDGEYPDLEL